MDESHWLSVIQANANNLIICYFPKVIIKDTSLVLTPANIKAYILMTLQGLEYMHQHWVLHRVRALRLHVCPYVHMQTETCIFLFLYFSGSEAQ